MRINHLALAAAGIMAGVAAAAAPPQQARREEPEPFDGDAAWERYKARREQEKRNYIDGLRREAERTRPIVEAAEAKRERRRQRNMRIALAAPDSGAKE